MNLQQSIRFSLGAYVKPLQLDPGMHRIKPTLSVSPLGWVYIHLALLPHRAFFRSQTQLTLNIEKKFSFGYLQVTLFSKHFAPRGNFLTIPATEQIRQKVSLPLTERVSVVYTEGTILASATVFEKRGQVRLFQGVEAKPVLPVSASAPVQVQPILSIVILVFPISYVFSPMFQIYSRRERLVILGLSVGCLIILFCYKFFSNHRALIKKSH